MTPRVRPAQQYDVLVIGGGQAGLAMGRQLQRDGHRFLILDAAARVGDSWRARWDSLRLFTPARYSALPDMPFPAPPEHLPTKDEVADYLARYARTFALPLALDEPVHGLRALGPNRLRVTTGFATYEARHVVVATGGHQAPHLPALARSLPPHIVQIHSSAYRSPAQLPAGPVVVVGAGNSGVQIAAELAATHKVVLATGAALRPVPARILGKSLFWWLENTGAMRVAADSPMGRRARRTTHHRRKRASADRIGRHTPRARDGRLGHRVPTFVPVAESAGPRCRMPPTTDARPHRPGRARVPRPTVAAHAWLIAARMGRARRRVSRPSDRPELKTHLAHTTAIATVPFTPPAGPAA